MKDFTLSPDAVQDIEETFDVIAQDDPDAAVRFLESLYETLLRLTEMPGMGRSREDFFSIAAQLCEE